MPDLIGTPGQVRARLEVLHASGKLISLTPPQQHGPGQVVVRVQLRDVQPRQHHDRYPDKVDTRPRQDWRVPAAVCGFAVVVGVALVALIWWAVLWVWHWVGAHLPLVVGTVACVLGALLGIWYLLGRAGVCRGFHCPGCRHR
jgi:hypothetical protein